jgi:hypothetical protein
VKEDMKPILSALLTALLATSCSQRQTDDKGLIVLKNGDAVAIWNTERTQMIAVGNIDNELSASQIDTNGRSPAGFAIMSATQTMISINRIVNGIEVYLIDRDGDGIPEVKVENTLDGGESIAYRPKKVEWEKVEPEDAITEPAPPAGRGEAPRH